jgi:hypothetical protein
LLDIWRDSVAYGQCHTYWLDRKPRGKTKAHLFWKKPRRVVLSITFQISIPANPADFLKATKACGKCRRWYSPFVGARTFSQVRGTMMEVLYLAILTRNLKEREKNILFWSPILLWQCRRFAFTVGILSNELLLTTESKTCWFLESSEFKLAKAYPLKPIGVRVNHPVELVMMQIRHLPLIDILILVRILP